MREAVEEDMSVHLSSDAISIIAFLWDWDAVTDLRLHEHQVDEDDHVVMLYIFVRKTLAPRTLCQANITADGICSLGLSAWRQAPV